MMQDKDSGERSSDKAASEKGEEDDADAEEEAEEEQEGNGDAPSKRQRTA